MSKQFHMTLKVNTILECVKIKENTSLSLEVCHNVNLSETICSSPWWTIKNGMEWSEKYP